MSAELDECHAMNSERGGAPDTEGQRVEERGKETAVPSGEQRHRPRRRVVVVSEVDQRLIDLGLPPSWEERVSDRDEVPLRSDSNDARLLENVPPHAQPRI